MPSVITQLLSAADLLQQNHYPSHAAAVRHHVLKLQKLTETFRHDAAVQELLEGWTSVKTTKP